MVLTIDHNDGHGLNKKYICTMKIIITIFLFFISGNLFSQTFISPINFVSSDENQNRVISFIEKNVYETYTSIGVGDPSTLRMMEKEELKSFKELTKVTNISLLRNVIKTYCSFGLCNYNTILMMYKEQEKSSNEKLSW